MAKRTDIAACRCGNRPKLVAKTFKFYHCPACGTSGPRRQDIESAADAWNAAQEEPWKQE